MYLLIEKPTNVVADIQAEQFSVDTVRYEWIEDKSVTDRSKVANFTYNKQNKQFTERPRAEQPRDIVAEKLASLEAQVASIKGEPVLGIAETADPSLSPLWLLLFTIPVALVVYLRSKKL